MNLNERKRNILNAIITEYISSSEPIGSRTIAKRYDIGLSSATIRNEMSDLEELGLIIQPHASAGRIPSDKGYRIYVDEILSSGASELDINLISQMINKNLTHIDYLMQETAKMLSSLTNYVTIISEPKRESLVFKHIQLSFIDEKSILLVMVMEDSIIKNKIINVSNFDTQQMDIENLSKKLNEVFKGKCVSEVTKSEVDNIRQSFDGDDEILIPILQSIIAEFSVENDYQGQVYTSGTDKIFNYPEFSDVGTAIELFKALEEKKLLLTLLGDDNSDSMQILIGSENEQEQLQNFSIVKSTYKVGNSKGCISVIGPKRMEYTNTINTVNSVTKLLEQILERDR
ncbi:MAG: heat-inducible transcriptional repressor HrcA [Lachnospirales bacterium]